MELNLIYHFQTSCKIEDHFTPARYGVVSFFSDQGVVEKELLLELTRSLPDLTIEDLTFQNLEDLKTFSLRVGQKLSANRVRIISVQDYNIGLDGAKDFESYKEIFKKYGEVMELSAGKKTGGLAKFFKA